MPRHYLKLQYSFICLNSGCRKQFEYALGQLLQVDKVNCPDCETAIDLRNSKAGGDLAEVFREVRTFEASRRRPG